MVGGQRISTVKSLGLWFDESLNDINQAKETSRTLQECLHKIDRCPLRGKFKFWVLSAYFYSDVFMELLVYEIATRTVESMEIKINKYTRKWLS